MTSLARLGSSSESRLKWKPPLLSHRDDAPIRTLEHARDDRREYRHSISLEAASGGTVGVLSQVVLALVSWLFVVVAPLARLVLEDRNVPERKRRGVSILPGWPLMPILFLAPMPFLGARHLVLRIIAIVHVVLLVWALGYIVYWVNRARREKKARR
jgi:hypothetical protein